MSTPKIKTATALRKDLYDSLKEVSKGKEQIITHKHGEPVILLSKESYDKMLDEYDALKKMAIGLSQIDSGEGIDHKSAKKRVEAFKSKWK